MIAKKFDKTIPTHKGALKGKICDDGKQADLLASKLVCLSLKLKYVLDLHSFICHAVLIRDLLRL